MRLLTLFIFGVCWLVPVAVPKIVNPNEVPRHSSTHWQLRPSLKYDTLCLLNALSGDPYYLRYYQAEYDHFRPLLSSDERTAFVRLRQIIKEKGGDIISAKLALYYSAVEDETLSEMAATAHDSSKMEAALRKTTYWNQKDWDNYKEAQPALETGLRALIRVDFPAYWARFAKPGIENRIAELSADLPKYNIVPLIEEYLGFSLPAETIDVYLLAYSEPHGIRVTGLQYLTHYSYPFDIVLHNAIHEPMHPPYDASDHDVRQAIQQLSRDPLIVEKVKHHDPSYGYNSASGYIEEDSVQALEEILSEKVGIGRDTCEYWKNQDGGMHVLAIAIYVQYKTALKLSHQTYSQWFVQAVKRRQLQGRQLERTIREFCAMKGPR